MAINHFAKGEHPTGFIGWRVVVPAGKLRVYQAYFSEKPEYGWSQENWSRRQELRAQIYDCSRQCRSILRQYRWKIRTDSKRVPHPFRVGAQGIRMYAERRQTAPGGWEFGFQVSRPPNRVPLKFPIRSDLYSEVWNTAVNAWAKHHDIRAKDREALRHRKPAPAQFKEVRKYLNENKGAFVPPEALRPVFAEQRRQLSNAKAQASLKSGSLSEEMAQLYAGLSKDIQNMKALRKQETEHGSDKATDRY